mmetsp:Transcript_137689/g.439876  ORF Transcript_137689/g.439876 Transcript_137689/m.439876 type:complete len:346 (-) Transcript_137689:885-1922(-)
MAKGSLWIPRGASRQQAGGAVGESHGDAACDVVLDAGRRETSGDAGRIQNRAATSEVAGGSLPEAPASGDERGHGDVGDGARGRPRREASQVIQQNEAFALLVDDPEEVARLDSGDFELCQAQGLRECHRGHPLGLSTLAADLATASRLRRSAKGASSRWNRIALRSRHAKLADSTPRGLNIQLHARSRGAARPPAHGQSGHRRRRLRVSNAAPAALQGPRQLVGGGLGGGAEGGDVDGGGHLRGPRGALQCLDLGPDERSQPRGLRGLPALRGRHGQALEQVHVLELGAVAELTDAMLEPGAARQREPPQRRQGALPDGGASARALRQPAAGRARDRERGLPRC